MKKLKIWYDSGYKEVREESNNYSLTFNGIISVKNGYCPVISCRDLEGYPSLLEKINSRYQYVEVGAGLGGFMNHLISKQDKDSPKPIVIDPANYNLIYDMLVFSLRIKDFSLNHDRLIELLKRCELQLNTEKISLINLSIGEAVETIENLEGIADIIVDNYGARTHNGFESNKDYIRKLLKKGRDPKKSIIGYVENLD